MQYICGQCYWKGLRESRQNGRPRVSPALRVWHEKLLELTKGGKPFPTMRQLQNAMGKKSPRGAGWAVHRLEDLGLVKNTGGKRSVVREKKTKE